MRLCIAVVAAGLLCGDVGRSSALQQQLAAEVVAHTSKILAVPPQLLLYLSWENPSKSVSVLRLLRRAQEQQLWKRLPIDMDSSPSTRQLRELLQQALRPAQDKLVADFNSMLQQNVWEGMSLFSFTYDLSSDVQFFLDSQYGTHTLISSAHYGGVSGFSVMAPQRQRVFDFSTVAAVDIEQDFFALQALPPPVFTPRHYVFHGEQYVYVLNRETLALEYVGHSDTEIDDQLALANRVHKIDLVNAALLSVRYRNASGREFVQLIDLDNLTTTSAREINGLLRAVAPHGKRLAVQNNRHLEVIDLDGGSKHVFPSRAVTSVRFSADGERLAYIDGDTLSLVNLAASTIQRPQRIALAPEQTLVSAESPANELLWDGDDLYVMHRAALFRVSSTGEIAWQRELPENMHALQLIDTQHLALFSEQEVLLFAKEDGARRVQLAVDKKQRIADQTFTDRYLSLLLEDRLHLGAFGLTLARIPLVQLLQLLEASPLLQKIAAAEKFTLQRDHYRFADLVLSAVEQHLQHNQVSTAQLVQLLRELYQTYHLVSGSYYVFANIADVLVRHEEEVAQLTADDPAQAELLRTSFF